MEVILDDRAMESSSSLTIGATWEEPSEQNYSWGQKDIFIRPDKLTSASSESSSESQQQQHDTEKLFVWWEREGEGKREGLFWELALIGATAVEMISVSFLNFPWVLSIKTEAQHGIVQLIWQHGHLQKWIYKVFTCQWYLILILLTIFKNFGHLCTFYSSHIYKATLSGFWQLGGSKTQIS